eukprot:SAG11_NODE_9649_length_892_cov_1.648172_1_plen_157_part_00
MCGSPFPKERCDKDANKWKKRCARCQSERENGGAAGGEADLRVTIDLARQRNPKSPSPADPNNDRSDRASLHTVTEAELATVAQMIDFSTSGDNPTAGNIEPYEDWPPAVARGDRPLAHGGPIRQNIRGESQRRQKQTVHTSRTGRTAPRTRTEQT